jgi:iron complex outermembrane receptor protein
MLPGHFSWDLSYGYGQDSERFKVSNSINFKHAEQEVGSIPCTSADIAAGCVSGDMFGPNGLSQAAVNYLRYTATSRAEFAQHAVDGTISGDLLDLPAGPLALAIGGAYRRESGSYTPDAVTLQGDQQGADAEPTSGGYGVSEGFLELKAPILGNLPAIEELELNGATRFSSYTNFGGATTWKAGLDWKVSEDLSFRAARSTGFRAPTISELFLGRTSIAGALNDPCDASVGITKKPNVAANCAAQGVAPDFQQPTNNYDTLLGGNRNLKPETSQNWSIGTVLTPRFIPNLSVTVDYFDIFIRDSIGALAATTIVQGCFQSVSLSSPLCQLIGPRGTLHNLTTITDLEANQGAIKTNGLDVTVAYGFDVRDLHLPDFGHIAFDDASTFTFSNRQQAGVGGPFVQLAGTVDQPTSATNPGAIAHFRSTGSLAWSDGPARFAWSTRFIGAVHGLGTDLSQLANHTPAVFYHDIAGSYDLGRIKLIAGIDNLFDKNPPFFDDGTVNTSEYTYDLIGRFFYAKAVLRF